MKGRKDTVNGLEKGEDKFMKEQDKRLQDLGVQISIYRKQKKISRVAEYYCWKKQKLNQPCRFDVICVLGQEIRHIVNAFDYR